MLDRKDREILNLVQIDFPLEVRPYEIIGRRLGISEDDVIYRLKRLKEMGLIRQISAVFDSRALGYQSSLVAFKTEPARVHEIGKRVSEHSGVTHSYRRNHEFNLWFTITLPSGTDLQREVDKLADQEGVLAVRLFPTIRTFKIGVAFDMLSEKSMAPGSNVTADDGEPRVSREDIPIIRQLQRDLPLECRPFEPLANRVGISDEALLQKAKEFLQRGLMRRYAAVLRHREAGFAANAMGAWSVPEDRIEEFGRKAAAFAAVTHCYQRTTYPDWPYAVFTMIHGRTKEECESIARRIAEDTGIKDYVLLYSVEEFKKTRMLYFEE